MQVFESEDEFCDVKLGTVLQKTWFLIADAKRPSTALEIGDEVKILFRLETELRAHQKGAGGARGLDQQSDILFLLGDVDWPE